MNTQKRFLSYLRPYGGRITAAFLCMGVVALFNGISLWTLKPIIDRVFVTGTDTVEYTIPLVDVQLTGSRMGMLWRLVAFFLVTRFIYAIATYFQRYLMQQAGERVITDLRVALYNKFLTLSPRFYARSKAGELISQVTNDITLVQYVVAQYLTNLLQKPLEVVVLVGFLFFFNWKLAIISLFILPFVVGIFNKLGKKIRSRTARTQEKIADLTANLQETLTGISIVQGFSMERYESDRFKKLSHDYYARSMRTIRVITLTTPLMEFITALGVGGVILYGGRQVIVGNMTPGTFFTFIAMLMALYQPIKTLVNVANDIQRSSAGLDRIFRLLDQPVDIADASGAVELPSAKGRVEIQHVSFCYDDENVLTDVSFTAERGEVVALVGPSGAGKTTLVNLIPRFYDVTSGAIQVDGRDIREATLFSLRSQIGIVTQETILFHDTVRANIAYGRPEIPQEEIETAARRANAHDFIRELPMGYDTVIGDRGVRLSGGQRQRLAIARAILKNPPILILDEATSALDTESERLVQSALAELMEGRTSFVIAHRLSTVRRADKIIVLENGQIAEQGRHEVLLQKDGAYARLYRLQFAAEDETA